MVENKNDFSVIDVLNWRAERVFSIVATVLIALSMLRDMDYGFRYLWPWIIAITFSGSAVFASFYFPDKLKKWNVLMYISVSGIVFLANIYRNNFFISYGIEMPMFNAYKIVGITMALLAPRPVWVGYFIITLCLFIPPLQILFLSPEFDVSKYGEQWMPMFYAIISYFVLDYRVKSQARYAEIVKTNISEQTMSDFMEISIELRDQARKSIQSLQMITEMMDSEKYACADLSPHLKQSVQELSQILRIFDEARERLSNTKTTTYRDSE